MNLLDDVAGILEGSRFRYADEEQLQEGIEAALVASGVIPVREVRLTPRDRIDLMVGGIGIEVKVGSDAAAVLRQLRRYAASPEVTSLILVTSRARHAAIPDEIDGKPVRVVSLLGQSL